MITLTACDNHKGREKIEGWGKRKMGEKRERAAHKKEMRCFIVISVLREGRVQGW